MHGDEGELEAAGEEAEHQQHIGAVAERLGQRLPDRLLRPDRRRLAGVAAGVASASDSGMISSSRQAKIISVVCQPKLSIRATPSGENRNWPNEPAAVPAPKASERQLSGTSLPNADDHQVERAARQAEADQHAGGDAATGVVE